MSPRHPPFNALYAFMVTARHLNLTKAADELCVTQGAVSRQIANLEAHLGCQLFHRHARGLHLSAAGEALLPDVSAGFTQLLQAASRLEQAAGQLHLKAPTCAMRWLLPRLQELEQQHPELDIVLHTTTEHGIDFQREPFDVAIVYRTAQVTEAGDLKLFDEQIVPVVAPSLLSRYPSTPGNLPEGMPLLHPTRDRRDWQQWLQSQGLPLPQTGKHQHFETMDLAISAAIGGCGMAMADRHLVEEDLRMGRLMLPSSTPVATGAAYYLRPRPTLDKGLQFSQLTDALLDHD
ncbi:LysR substrate-binding domain-containing protein [Pseudaeromonas sp. ZJS20]|uniref:LysR substrate-binding domain-containing protein n=1 Tax=Pseudaeromonas aegiceratis TaxID=3153928 RepID=UPI00390C5660